MAAGQAKQETQLVDTAVQGLSEGEAAERRKRGMENAFPLKSSRSYWQIIWENLFVSVNIIMFALGLALILLGQVSDALISVGVAFFNVVVATVQEIRARRLLDRISLLTRPRATVIRDGQERLVDPAELVVGDLLLVRPGDQIVVDGPLVSDDRLEMDESLLSGESEPVPKRKGDWLYSGSFCMSGSARYQAEKVGNESLASQLVQGARAFRRVRTPLQRQISVILQAMLLIALLLEVLLVLAVQENRISLVGSVKMAVVVIGIVPKGLLLATSVAYALGAVRMVGKGVLIQQANAIEALSTVDILCLDKTGTLTANALQLERLVPIQIEEVQLRRLLGDYAGNLSASNTTIAAIAAACPGHHYHASQEVPFSSEREWSALTFDEADMQGAYVLGAPEKLRGSFSQEQQQGLATCIETETAQGRRVLLFACRPDPVPLYDQQGQPTLPADLVPLGLVSLRDQLRSEASQTLAAFAGEGIQLKIISGDHPDTVAALVKQAGFHTGKGTLSGEALNGMDTIQLAQVAEEHSVFGRITPQQKASLVQALRRRGHTVAMIGDGVNDVLSLKQADLGIAMQSGSAATRGVADVVLLEDSFAALPQMFQEGQRIQHGMHNILKLFLTRVSYMIILLIAIMIVDGFPFVPKQNAILTLLTEGIPALALASWARSGSFQQKRALRALLYFVLPAALTLSLLGLGVYLAVFSVTAQLSMAQSALTTFTIACGLLLIPFVEPPSKFWTGGSELGGDWRPSLLASGLLLGYAGLLAIAPLRSFFELTALDATIYLFTAAVALAWTLLVRWVWRAHLLERFLQVDWREE